MLFSASLGSSSAASPPPEREGARLVVSVEGTRDLLVAGQTVDFSVLVTNEGEAVAHKVTITQSVPEGLSPDEPTGRGQVAEDASSITWQQGALPPGHSIEVAWSAEVEEVVSFSPVSEVVATSDETGDAEAIRSFLALVEDPRLSGRTAGGSSLPSAGTARGDNTIYLRWEAGTGITEASSSRTLRAKARYELLSSASVIDEGDGLDSTITMRNLRNGKLLVQGVIVHRIHTSEGIYARLRSDPIDVVLKRGGAIRLPFKHGLPSGDYELSARFVATR